MPVKKQKVLKVFREKEMIWVRNMDLHKERKKIRE